MFGKLVYPKQKCIRKKHDAGALSLDWVNGCIQNFQFITMPALKLKYMHLCMTRYVVWYGTLQTNLLLRGQPM